MPLLCSIIPKLYTVTSYSDSSAENTGGHQSISYQNHIYRSTYIKFSSCMFQTESMIIAHCGKPADQNSIQERNMCLGQYMYKERVHCAGPRYKIKPQSIKSAL